MRGGVQAETRRDLAGDDGGVKGGGDQQLLDLPPRPHAFRLLRDRKPGAYPGIPGQQRGEPALERVDGADNEGGGRPRNEFPLLAPAAVAHGLSPAGRDARARPKPSLAIALSTETRGR